MICAPKMHYRRSNISFDNLLNMVRKDERDFIINTLNNFKDQLSTPQEKEIVQRSINSIIETVHVPYTSSSQEDGTSSKFVTN